jgi:hypothetical protein
MHSLAIFAVRCIEERPDPGLGGVAGAAEDAAGASAGVLAICDDDDAVDEDSVYALGILMRLLEGGFIDNCVGVEDRNVGKVALD